MAQAVLNDPVPAMKEQPNKDSAVSARESLEAHRSAACEAELQ